MTEPIWIEARVVLAMHERLLAEHGGAGGVRDRGLLESALARPLHLFTYQNSDLVILATAYMSGIVHSHPFIDGNKRTGFMTGYVFLARNQLQLIASESEAASIVLALAANEVSEEVFVEWLRKNVMELDATKPVKAS